MTGTERAITYPADLPISARRDDIAAAIREHQVVVVAGETGSGKTTQLPKICLELGRGTDRLIGHTQPRRIAARNVAERIASELGTELGDLVGYQVRFTDKTSPASRIKLMTDGILLAELQRDRDLRRYDTIIIDEAHERSLNIDFLLGYLKQLLPRRPDLKVVITSATIDTERFAGHFAQPNGEPAPVVEVSGRTYPVEIRYRPLAVETDEADEDGETIVRDQTEAIRDAVAELKREAPGDILVFLPGEREIRDTAEDLGSDPGLEVLPLFSRLSAAEQQRVFKPGPASSIHRRVVLATNVAETSLTVPGIRYVIDTGVARISRYSTRSKVQRLPIEAISQASANQRSGRCGRVGPGIAIRLYAEEDFEGRPEFTDPEVLRTNLASVILQMASLRLGDITRFPFVEPPPGRSLAAGRQLLEELRAVKRGSADEPRLTRIGQRLARLPVDPRLGRMLLEAERLGCLREVIVIVAALSLQDPRERPAEQRAHADQLHARFTVEGSDFLTMLALWDYVREQQRERSGSAFRRMCKAEHLNYLRVREWQEFESQLRQVCREMKLDLGKPPKGAGSAPDADAVHRALLAGLLSHVGLRKERDKRQQGRARKGERPGPREYLGARGTSFAIFPGSGLARKNPELVMAAELVETSRLFARTSAAIKPEWVEKAAGDLVSRSYAEPHWSKKRAAVMAREKVTLFGIPIIADRPVSMGKVDPELSRELFIRHALVYGEWHARHRFLNRNRELLDEAAELEHRTRRRDLVVDEFTLFDFYDARIPAEVVSGAHFDSWWKQERRTNPERLTFELDMLTHDTAAEVKDSDYPTTWTVGGGLTVPIGYHFDPGSAEDGLTIDIPTETLNQLEPGEFSWNVPGLRAELVTALLRGLPKPLRVQVVPAPDTARAFLADVVPGGEPLLDALERYLRATKHVVVERGDWDVDGLPAHLRPTFRIVDADGTESARGRDLGALQADLTRATDLAIATAAREAAAELSQTGHTTWSFGELPETATLTRAGHDVVGFPALTDEGRTVGSIVVADRAWAQARHRAGLRRLLALALGPAAAKAIKELPTAERLALAGPPYESAADLGADVDLAVAGELLDPDEVVRDAAAFEVLVERARAGRAQLVPRALRAVTRALEGYREVDKVLSGRTDMAELAAVTDMKRQVDALLGDGFVSRAGLDRLERYPVYLHAIRRRRQALSASPRGIAQDADAMARLRPLLDAHEHAAGALPEGQPPTAEIDRVRWMLEELRVSIWAQDLKTAEPVSDQRVRKALDAIGRQ